MALRRSTLLWLLAVWPLALFTTGSCASGSNATLGADADTGAADAGPLTIDAALPDPDPDAAQAACAANPCFAGVECTNMPSGFTCGPCPAGHAGDGISCVDIDSCAAAPCYIGVACTDLAAPEDGFTCGECPAGLFGNGVECTDVDGCDGDPCFEGVACVDNAPPETGFTCGSCPTGYEGDGLSCTDINGCAGDPCFGDLTCTDNPAPQTGFECDDCPPGHIGDGQTCTLLCDPVSSITCGGLISSSTTAAGSTDQIDEWQCSSFTLNGPERVYTFVAPASGIATAELTGLNGDVDLLVIKASTTQPGLCDSVDSNACLPGGASANVGLASERSRWNAIAGTTYFIIVDGFDNAVSNFTLRVKTGTEDVLLNEIGYGTADYVELRNHGACPADLGGMSLSHKASLSTGALTFAFPNGTTVAPGNVLRWIESGADPYSSNEIDAGVSIPDLPFEPGFTALCNGTCDMSGCSNILDYVERDDDLNDESTTGGPACAGFAPAPINCAGQSGNVSLHRTGFAGASGPPQATDWTFATSTRD